MSYALYSPSKMPIVLLALAVMSGVPLYGWWKFLGWQSWPSVEGTVDSAEVFDATGRGRPCFTADLGFSYTVDGSNYSGNFERDFSESSGAYEYTKAMQGSSVAVRYHPEKIDRSRLDIDVGKSFWKSYRRCVFEFFSH